MGFSVGLIEMQGFTTAVTALDTICKAADVSLIAVERKLGGRLVTLVVSGEVSAVQAAIDAGKVEAAKVGKVKSTAVIPRPHPEILKFWGLDENGNS